MRYVELELAGDLPVRAVPCNGHERQNCSGRRVEHDGPLEAAGGFLLPSPRSLSETNPAVIAAAVNAHS